jgi:hypothetical protein
MKHLLLVITLLFQNNKFYENVLSDYSLHSKYVALEVNSKKYVGKVVIENIDLYNYLCNMKKISIDDYKKLIINLMESNIPLDIHNANLPKWTFLKVIKNISIDKIAAEGKDVFLKTFFLKGISKNNVNDTNKAAIIFQLFKYGVAVKTDCESGRLVIPAV